MLDELSTDESWITTLTQIHEQLSQTAHPNIANMRREMYSPTLRLGLLAALSALLALYRQRHPGSRRCRASLGLSHKQPHSLLRASGRVSTR